jgi:hypothetical protein
MSITPDTGISPGLWSAGARDGPAFWCVMVVMDGFPFGGSRNMGMREEGHDGARINGDDVIRDIVGRTVNFRKEPDILETLYVRSQTYV